ncbi:MAG: hypothetical protein WA131_06635 [Desulfitobacteriaceae bacterium]
MWPFSKKLNFKIMAEEFSEVVSVYSSYGYNRLKEIFISFDEDFSEDKAISIFLEYNVFILHIFDKYSTNYYGNVLRSEFVNKTIDEVKAIFCSLESLQIKDGNKGAFFENFFKEAFYSYPQGGSLLGCDNEQVTKYFNERIVRLLFNGNANEKQKYMSLIIYEMLENFVIEVFKTKPFVKYFRT